MKKFKLFSIVVLALVLLLAGCGSNRSDEAMTPWTTTSSQDNALSFEPALTQPAAPPPTEQATPAPSTAPSTPMQPPATADSAPAEPTFKLTIGDASSIQRMIIRSANIGLRTYCFEDTVAGIERIMTARGGFIENSRQWMAQASHDTDELLWRAEFTLRVPVGLFDQVNRELVALAQVRRFSTESEDVTMEFHDLASRLTIREEEMRRVEVMLAAATDTADIIRLEAQLTNLRLAVDAYQRRMTEIDQLAGFSTIRVTVEETILSEEPEEEVDEYYPVYYPTDDGFGTRIANAFAASVNFCITVLTYLAMFFAAVGLPVVLLAGIGFIAYVIVKRTTKFRFK